MKDAQLTIRIEPELRSNFSEAVEKNRRSVAQVLREFMEIYVQEAQGQSHALPERSKTVISAFERLRRARAIGNARASVELEGFKSDAQDNELERRYVAGEIEISDAINAIYESAKR
ncbi:antitoxin VbhA family protein (plasmid) [Ampullimonas aquatilis]|uniref:antitoxin VbhA family protein n=1 Tax=Ampullimonas aquatilis TaxID=1341549 RepID=UPI003C770256